MSLKDSSIKTLLLFLFVTNCTIGLATTWDEPWQEDILQEAEYFVKGKVSSATDSTFEVEIEKCFGDQISGTILINGWYMLDLCSWSGGHGPEFRFEDDSEAYFFLKKGEDGNYLLPTPTSGFAAIVGDKVHATYRHSYHQAAISAERYEWSYTQIWNHVKGRKTNIKEVQAFIDEQLKLAPAGFDPSEMETFFDQHVAMETAYLMEISIPTKSLKPFAESENFHAQVSALRAMKYSDDDAATEYLFDYLDLENISDFSKVIAIWSFWDRADKAWKKKLWKRRDTLSEEDTSFGGNIMDPRVCTHMPSPKYAVIELKG